MLNEISFISLFPQIIDSYLQESIIKNALLKNLLTIKNINLRDFSGDPKHHKVDDIPYGGSTGMVIQVEPVVQALKAINNEDNYTIMLSPSGKTLDMQTLKRLLSKSRLTLLAGRYEGFDKRVDSYISEKISIGNYVLTGGELPMLVLADCLIRLIPGVLGNSASYHEDSFYNGLLDWDVFTRPQIFDILNVPEVLTSGNHKLIERWKKRSAIINTLIFKPDILAGYKLNKIEKQILLEYLLEEEKNERTN